MTQSRRSRPGSLSTLVPSTPRRFPPPWPVSVGRLPCETKVSCGDCYCFSTLNAKIVFRPNRPLNGHTLNLHSDERRKAHAQDFIGNCTNSLGDYRPDELTGGSRRGGVWCRDWSRGRWAPWCGDWWNCWLGLGTSVLGTAE